MTKRVWAGLDVGVETTSLCIVDDKGEVLQQAVCATALKSVHGEIRWIRRRRAARVGLEAGTGASLARGLRTLGYCVDIYETRQLSKFLRSRRNKTDAGDASGIAEAGRIGATMVSKVHLKSLECQELQSRLTMRRHLIRERVAAVNLLCRQLELFGGRVAPTSRASRLREHVEGEMQKLFGRQVSPLTTELRALLDRCEDMVERQQRIDADLMRLASNHEVCRRLMTVPGVGPICALTFYASVDDPSRFRRSAEVGAYFGLTPKIFQSGLTKRSGRISKMGNAPMRSLLVQSSMAFMRTSAGCPLRDWASRVVERRGAAKARVALARRIAVIMLAMWKNGLTYMPEGARGTAAAPAR